MELNPVEIRVLGALIEKDMTTPDYYPMSLNALLNACNQKTNREPVTAYDEATVMEGLEGLRSKSLAVFVHESGSRVEKYRHRILDIFHGSTFIVEPRFFWPTATLRMLGLDEGMGWLMRNKPSMLAQSVTRCFPFEITMH